jgi:hypothetical protein
MFTAWQRYSCKLFLPTGNPVIGLNNLRAGEKFNSIFPINLNNLIVRLESPLAAF